MNKGNKYIYNLMGEYCSIRISISTNERSKKLIRSDPSVTSKSLTMNQKSNIEMLALVPKPSVAFAA